MSRPPGTQARRIAHERAVIRRGQHPLCIVLGEPVELHPAASTLTKPGRPAKGITCGDCLHRGKTKPTCELVGLGAQAPGWWPACSRYRKPVPRGDR